MFSVEKMKKLMMNLLPQWKGFMSGFKIFRVALWDTLNFLEAFAIDTISEINDLVIGDQRLTVRESGSSVGISKDVPAKSTGISCSFYCCVLNI